MFEPIDFDNLPDDPYEAFIRLVEFFDLKLEREIRGKEDTDTRRHLVSHMNSILGAARALDIDQLASWNLPDYDDTYTAHSNFDLAVKSLVLQFQIKRARVAIVYSVTLDAATKARIHNLVKDIREILEDAHLEERKKNSLFAKLNAFEADVDRSRTRFENAMLAFIDIADLAQKGSETLKPVTDLVKRINELLGNAKANEPEQEKLPSPRDTKRIEPPRKQIGGPRDKLDDEIPF